MKKQQQKPISDDAVSEIKRHFDQKTTESKRHFDVVAEGLNDKISIIAEQYGDIKKTLDSHTEMIGAMKEDTETIRIDLADTKKDVEIIKTDIKLIKGDIKKKVDHEEFVVLERRVTFMEAKVRR